MMIGSENMSLKIPRGLKIFFYSYIFIAVFGTLLSNEKPLLCIANSSLSFPVFNNKINQSCDFKIKAIIPYSYYSIDDKNRGVSPFAKQNTSGLYNRHWLGTDGLGRDVLAGLIRGARISFLVGSISLGISLLVGLLLAYLSAIIGDHHFRLNLIQIISAIILFSLFFFYLLNGLTWLSIVIFILGISISYFLKDLVSYRKYAIPLDWIITRLIEFFKIIPKLFLLLFLMTLIKRPYYINIILIIALISWPGITRFIRAELLEIKTKEYYQAAEAIGMSKFKIFINHGIRNAIQPVLVALAFGFAVTILMEATLSFLGLGIPPEEVSWGSMLSEARNNFRLWWMVLFPGIAIFLCVVSLNKLGDIYNNPD